MVLSQRLTRAEILCYLVPVWICSSFAEAPCGLKTKPFTGVSKSFHTPSFTTSKGLISFPFQYYCRCHHSIPISSQGCFLKNAKWFRNSRVVTQTTTAQLRQHRNSGFGTSLCGICGFSKHGVPCSVKYRYVFWCGQGYPRGKPSWLPACS